MKSFSRPDKSEILKVESIKLSEDNTYMRIETPRLIIEPLSRDDAEAYYKIFCDEQNMHMYQNGGAKTHEWVKKRLDSWASKWERGYPYAGMKVQLKQLDGTAGEIIGHVVCGDGEEVGVSEMAFAFKRYAENGAEVWNHRFATEALNALVNHAIPMLKAKGIHVMAGPTEETEELADLTRIVSTARPDNIASCKLLEHFCGDGKVHAKAGTETHQYNDARDIYSHEVHDKKMTAVERLEAERESESQVCLGGEKSVPVPGSRRSSWVNSI